MVSIRDFVIRDIDLKMMSVFGLTFLIYVFNEEVALNYLLFLLFSGTFMSILNYFLYKRNK